MCKFIRLTNQNTNKEILVNTLNVTYIERTDNGTLVYFNTLKEIEVDGEKDYIYYSITVCESFSLIDDLLGVGLSGKD